MSVRVFSAIDSIVSDTIRGLTSDFDLSMPPQFRVLKHVIEKLYNNGSLTHGEYNRLNLDIHLELRDYYEEQERICDSLPRPSGLGKGTNR